MSKAANKAATARIIALMKEQGVSKPFWNSYVFGVRVELNELPRKLQKGERLFTVIPCKYKGRRGIVAVTSLRVIVLNTGYFGIFSNNSREDVYYTQSAGGNPSGGYISSYSISVYGNGNDIEITHIWGHDAELLDKWYNRARRTYESNVADNMDHESHKEKLGKLKAMLRAGQIDTDTYERLLLEI